MKKTTPCCLKGISLFCLLSSVATASAAVVDPLYAGSYTLADLGSVPGVPNDFGGLTLKKGDPNTLLIGGAANTATGSLYSIGVTRDIDNHIIGFTGTASFFADAAYNDGGVEYGPSDVLFLTRWPVNELGQTKLGSTITDKIIDLTPLGVSSSPGGLAFVPPTHPGAGLFKMVSYDTGDWYTLGLSADGSGTYDISSVTFEVNLGGAVTDPEGIAYVPIGSALFPNPSVLVSEFVSGKVETFEVDANGDPLPGTRKDFVTGLSGAEGAFIDPLTGDFLFSTFGTGDDHVVVVKGFEIPPPRAPDQGTTFGLLLCSLVVIAFGARRAGAAGRAS